MISLFLDTSSSYLNIGVLNDKKLLKEEYIYFEKDLSKYALNEIKKLLDSLNLKPNDIDNIYCVNGPGSFTGLRIGVTIAKTFAWGLNKDLYKVIERDNTYYLYINKYKAFIVSKEGISKNNIEKLSNNFKDKVSTYKYIK